MSILLVFLQFISDGDQTLDDSDNKNSVEIFIYFMY